MSTLGEAIAYLVRRRREDRRHYRGSRPPVPTSPDPRDDRFRVRPRPQPEAAFFTRWPVEGRISSRYGSRVHPTLRDRRFHHGVDIAAPTGTPVIARAAGIVTHAGGMGTYGNTVVVDHGGARTSLYAHLSAVNVAVGDHVDPGAVVGLVGSTGRSTGPHLHFEVREHGRSVDPGLS